MAIDADNRMRRSLAWLLWPGLELAVWGDDVVVLDVVDEERKAVERAVPTRQQEFLRGRSCLRACLVRLDALRSPILPATSREPQLPSGFVGSITHGAGVVAALAAPATWGAGVGLDIEEVGRMHPDTVDLVLSPSEREKATGASAVVDGAILAFSAKESVHKALFPSSRRWFDFLDVELDITAVGHRADLGEWGRFHPKPAAHLPRADAALLDRVQGRYLASERFVFTVCRFE
jgi:4'-phosphopantetheinyl transferase EntD